MLEVDEEISQRLDAIKENMDKSLDEMVEEMKLDSEAADAAKLTMDGYISQLKSSGDTAVQQAQSIASRITAALSVDVSTAVSNAAAAVRGFTANVNATLPVRYRQNPVLHWSVKRALSLYGSKAEKRYILPMRLNRSLTVTLIIISAFPRLNPL